MIYKEIMSRRTGDPKVAVGWIRVSTEEQRLGPEAQRAAIEVWAQREGVNVVAWYCDQGVSGGSDLDERPGLIAALGALREHSAGVLVIAKRDRLARDVYVAATLERAIAAAGARVVCADGVANGDSPADEFLRTILDGAAAYERGLIRARTRAALGAKRARGERVGSVPYGYRLAEDGRTLRQDDAERAVVDWVLALRSAGLSLRAIVEECRLNGVKSRAGRAFTKTKVERIIRAASPAQKVG
jgi:DNA invertase Pin-like site-specific DNA recombinase